MTLSEIGAEIICPVDEHRMTREKSVTAVPPMVVSVVSLARSKNHQRDKPLGMSVKELINCAEKRKPTLSVATILWVGVLN